MDKDALLRLGPALDQFLAVFEGCAVAPTRRLIATYVRGQLSALPRKSVKPIALQAGIPARTLQELLSLHRWDEALLLGLLQRRVRQGHAGPRVAGMLFETRCVKKGDRTPGVARQTSETAGRPRNCVVLVHLALFDADFHALLDSAVYLPESWAGDLERRRAAGVPDELPYRSKGRIAMDLLRRAEANGHSLGRLLLPADYATDPGFLEGRALAVWPEAADPAAAADEAGRHLLRAGLEARRILETRMREIGLDHFEVRTFRSLTRHLALSAVSLLFLAEQSERARRDRGSLPLRSHA